MEFNFIKRKTKSGVVLWILPMAHYGSVSVGVAVKVGTRDEIWPKEAGIAHALEHMHFQGTKNFLESKDLTEYIEETGGGMNAWTDTERTLYYARVPSNYIDRAINIISEQIKYALIPEEKISTEMKNIVQEIRRRNDNPTRYLYYISRKFIYNNHPLSKDVLGLEESVQNFKREDFINFKKRYYDPANFIFTVVGNVNPDQAVDLFDKYFPEEIIENNRNQRSLDKIEIPENKRNVVRKDIEQTHISLDALTNKASDDSTLYLEFFANMISGGMSFPLFQEIRDKLGLCYEIEASMVRQSDFGRFNIYVGTDHKRYTEAINAIFQIIDKYKADESLLEKVKKLKLGELTLDYENTGYILRSAINDIIYLGRPRGFKEIIDEIQAVSINNITRSVNQYLKKDLFFTTILAPKSFLE
jgi:predicted Zn-dependent peptidase